ncbi:hypothetical protein [Candidatus Protochlamydia phocaeensis]|uniref:hypothetical protein n=1 Tax=Candidatus Protochlamydia phocaeensis TaxID=1414722 RepID=UPI000839742C|nr:hypothetical protein [Candidatus Protochlamydia phocaeensis]
MKVTQWKKVIYGGLLASLLLFGAARLYYSLTDDFRLSNMTYQFDFEVPWKVEPLTGEEQRDLTAILQQKFFYIGKGAQSYAFASEDQAYVLKFFKFKHVKPNWLIHLLPPVSPFNHYKAHYLERKKRKLIGVFEGYDLAYRKNRQAAGLIYLHLGPTDFIKQQVTVIDKLGLRHRINLDDVVFMVQKKGETLRARLTQLLNANRVQAAKEAISRLLDMYEQEYQKGVYDRDHGVLFNTGFIGDTPFHLDVGKLSENEQMKQVGYYKKDLEHVVWKIDAWIKVHYPAYYSDLTAHLAQEYKKRTGELFDASSIDPQRFKRKKRSMLWGRG